MNFLILWSLLFSSALQAIDLFSHRLTNVPIRSEGCQSLGQDLADRFIQKAEVEFYSLGVVSHPKTCDFDIGYLAENRVRTVESIEQIGFNAEPYQAAYSSQETCEAQMDREKRLFEKQTALSPWVSYCYQEDRILSWQNFVPFVQAIGSSGTRLYKASSYLWLRPVDGWQPFHQKLVEAGKAQKQVQLASMSYEPGTIKGDRELSLRFYAQSRHWLQFSSFAKHKNPDVCLSQIERVRTKLATAESPPFLVYCGKGLADKHELVLLQLRPTLLSMHPIRVSKDPKQFPTLDHCLNAMDDLETFYKEKLNRPILAGFCAGTDTYQATLFENQ